MEEKAWKRYIDNWHCAGETMIVQDSGLHLMPIKAYLVHHLMAKMLGQV